MSFALTNKLRLCCLLLFAFVVAYTLVRDMRIERQYTSDLRNRIVGSRLQAAGKMPYSYKWQKEDGLYYFIPNKPDSVTITTVTASPFLHDIMYPISGLSHRTISIIWFYATYFMFLAMVAIAVYFTWSTKPYFLVLVISGLFLFTDAWLKNIAAGQFYILIPFLLTLFFVCFTKKKWALFFAGLFAIMVVLIRPTCCFIFLPFLVYLFTMNKKEIITFFLPIVVLLSLIVINKNERLFWVDYANSLQDQVDLHHNQQPLEKKYVQNFRNLQYPDWEGWDKADIEKATALYGYEIKSRNGNFFSFYEMLFHKKIPVAVLNFLSLGSIAIIFLVFLYKQYHLKLQPSILLSSLFGFGFYMISEFLSPIHRHHYNAVLWLFPLLLLVVNYKPQWQWLMLILLLSLVININAFTFIALPHVVGEFLMWMILVIICFKEFNQIDKPKSVT